MSIISAPGKAFLFGEYAVLEGASAVVAAVDVRAFAWEVVPRSEGASQQDDPRCGWPACEPTAEILAATEVTNCWLVSQGKPTINSRPALDSRRFAPGLRKLGFGSSAAVTVATVAWMLEARGYQPSEDTTRAHVHRLAQKAHHDAQGGGSGGDVAASTFGGLLSIQRGKVTPLERPPWLHLAFFDAGESASTRALLADVQRSATTHQDVYAAAIRTLGDAADHAIQGLATPDAAAGYAQIREACRAHAVGLTQLEALAEVDINTPNIRGVMEIADSLDLCAKPSGAGGGDIVVAFATSRAALDKLSRRVWNDLGVRPISDIECAAQGVRTERRTPVSSRIAGLYQRSVEARQRAVSRMAGLEDGALSPAAQPSFGLAQADHMIENVVGLMSLPVGVATNFTINGRDVLVPMCVEEASVVAAASNAAKMIREGGGFVAHSDPPWMIAQIQLVCGPSATTSAKEVKATVLGDEENLFRLADDAHPRLIARGGGARELQVRILADDTVVVHLLVDCCDAMGANLINTVAEVVASPLEELTGWTPCLRILSNLSDARASHVRAHVPPEALASIDWSGEIVVDRIVEASRFAELDPYRATTHNKGIMNGVDAVVLATGNDWRAMEASAHAYAARAGRYRPLAVWNRDSRGWLVGAMSLPTAIGVVGGATRSHPAARAALEVLGTPNAKQLGLVIACAGLACNLAALRALATEGIQRGHMGLHARSIAAAAGAAGDEVPHLARKLIESGEIKLERARALLASIRASSAP